MCNKTKNEYKINFDRYFLQCFNNERFLVEYKEVCLKINGKQTVKLTSGSIKFKNCFKKLAVLFKIYADFECNVKRVKSSNRDDNTSYTKGYQDNVSNGFAYKVVCADDKFIKQVVLYRGKNEFYKFIDAIFKEYDYCKKIIITKKTNNNLVISAEDEE